jgi:predicted RNA binding protein YcfA (HicA-like mRNA interferase family)
MSKKLPVVSGPELVRVLERIRFVRVRQAGSHLTLEREHLHATVPMHGNKPLSKGTLSGILRSCEMSVDDLRKLLGR